MKKFKIDKDKFSRLISERCNKILGKDYITIGDANVIIDVIIGILQNAIANRWGFSVNGFGKIVYSKKKEHENIDMNTGERILIPEKETVRFVISDVLKELTEE